MELLFILIGVTLVVLIALVSVGRVVNGLSGQSRPAVYKLPDAVDWIADRLPDEVTARVSYEDVARILGWHLDWFSQTGLSSKHGEEIGGESALDGSGVAVEDAAIDAVVARSLDERGPVPVDVVCVLDLQMRYLEAIGAIEPEGDDGNDTT